MSTDIIERVTIGDQSKLNSHVLLVRNPNGWASAEENLGLMGHVLGSLQHQLVLTGRDIESCVIFAQTGENPFIRQQTALNIDPSRKVTIDELAIRLQTVQKVRRTKASHAIRTEREGRISKNPPVYWTPAKLTVAIGGLNFLWEFAELTFEAQYMDGLRRAIARMWEMPLPKERPFQIVVVSIEPGNLYPGYINGLYKEGGGKTEEIHIWDAHHIAKLPR